MPKFPWQLKMVAKLVLSRLPIGYGTWRRLSMFKHGSMEQADYAIGVFEKHFRQSQLTGSRGFSVLELGPGDSVASAVIAHAHGAERTYLVDVGSFARMDIAPYRALVGALTARGHKPVEIDRKRDALEVLSACGGVYLTNGLDSLRQIPDASVDFIWSNAVLEHVERHAFGETLQELRRIIRDTGITSHRVDLQDHLAESLNNLRFNVDLWESAWFRRSGFYTNRLRSAEILHACDAAGFDAELVGVESWLRMPIAKHALASGFRQFSDDELRVRAIDLLASPRLRENRRRDVKAAVPARH